MEMYRTSNADDMAMNWMQKATSSVYPGGHRRYSETHENQGKLRANAPGCDLTAE